MSATTGTLPPGPRIPGFFQAILWGLRYPQFTGAARRRYGDTFTVRPGTMAPLVLTTDRDAIRTLLTGDPLARGHGNDAVRPLLGERSLLLLPPAEHLARRKLLLAPFHGDRVRDLGAMMQRVLDREVDGWRPGEVVAVLPRAQDVTIEVILRAVLGVEDAVTRDRFRRLIDDVLFYPAGHARLRVAARLAPRIALPHRVREAAAFASSLPSPAVSTYFPGLKARTNWNLLTIGWWRRRDALVAELDRHIAATRADPRLAERDDVLAMLLRAGELGTDDLHDDLIALIGAGHETTASAIAWGAVLLAHHPDVRERGVRAAATGDDEWLGALVKEVLRLRPPLPVAAGRTLTEPLMIAGHEVPAGTVILIDAWGLHHDPARHADPERFRPERFLGEEAEAYTWLPFGGGAHRCIGAGMAELEIRIALGTLLRRAVPTPADADEPPAARRGVVVVPHGGGRVRIAAKR